MGLFDISSWVSKPPPSTLPKCGACGLFRICKTPKMPVEGSHKRKILFVGEMPDENDDHNGHHFTGETGQWFRDLLEEVGVDLDDCSTTHAAICHSPKEGLKVLHTDSCFPNLDKAITTLKPNVIIPMGYAARSLIEPEWGGDFVGPQKWVGFTIPSSRFNAWVCPTYEPGFVRHHKDQSILRLLMTRQLQNAIALEAQTPAYSLLDALHGEIQVITDPKRARKRMRALSRSHGVLAFDYETTGLKPERKEQEIVCCSFSLDGKDTFACPIGETEKPSLSAVLTNRRLEKVASNLKFEERWSRRKLGHGVANWFWDVMLGAHCHDNRSGVCSVKFQGYVHFGLGDNNSYLRPFLETQEANGLNKIREAPINDVLRYCGVDSLIEYKVAMKQRTLLGMA